ncbi:hypothetical protein A8L34_24990 [Bacillus sp. FJAT-27264]|uniref:glycosyltransferase family 2 protein n=1 Tax=Paenibacillus sp. (strain DSM 101736 / FJAT-27264) TaxID=1850362 RepID=UPI000807B1F1|nr:glycosyltransferase [Bacillus sp. FJAT-27264]OBZ07889.1 hypothetical protein A8L34_24990 [Bacillus sp. FJAT-27264]
MSNNIKVSIITPMFNVQEYISETILSVLAQTLNEFELIIIDDESTDNSYKIAEAYAKQEQRIFLHKLTTGKGASAARNYGMSLAQGQYLYFLDADDLLVPDTLETLMKTAITEQADMVIGHHSMFNERSEGLAWVYDKYPKLKISGAKEILADLELLHIPYACGKLYKRELLKNSKFPIGIRFGEDQVFTTNAYLNSKKIYLVDKVLYKYRSRQGQVTKSTDMSVSNITDIINVFGLVKKLVFNSEYGEEDKVSLYAFYLNNYLFRNLFSFVSHGLLSNDHSIQLVVLQKYKEWVHSLDSKILLHISDGLFNVNYRISKMLSLFESDVQQSCNDLFFAVDNMVNNNELVVKSTPKITIQTVAYNVENYIRECAESVINQTFHDFEWLVLDNGSTDNTLAILREYALKDKRIKLFHSEKNSITHKEELNTDFVDYVFNLKSEYWCALDSDDFLHHDFLNDLYTAALNTDADVAVAGTQKFYEDGSRPPELRLCPDFSTTNVSSLGGIFPSVYFMFTVYWGKLIKSSLLINVFRYKENNSLTLRHANDTLFCLTLLKMAKSIVSISKSLHFYRIRNDSYYNSFIDTQRYLDNVSIYKINKELLIDWDYFNNLNEKFIAEKLYFSIINCLEIITRSETIELKEKLQAFDSILADEFIYDVFSKMDMIGNFFAETKRMIKEISQDINDEAYISSLEFYSFRLNEAIDVINSNKEVDKVNTALIYLSSIVDVRNINNFGSIFIFPFLSFLNQNISSQIEKLGIDPYFLAQNIDLLIEIINSDYAKAAEISEKKQNSTSSKQLLHFFSQINSSVDPIKLEQDKQLMLNLLASTRAEDVDSGIEILLDILQNRPLDKEALKMKLILVTENNDLITAAETTEILKAFYSNDPEAQSLIEQVKETFDNAFKQALMLEN